MVVVSQPALEQRDFVTSGSGYIYIYVGLVLSILSISLLWYGNGAMVCLLSTACFHPIKSVLFMQFYWRWVSL